ncbi:MAG: hypothetical protein ACREEM_30575 [Blastocatellia bacterium]
MTKNKRRYVVPNLLTLLALVLFPICISPAGAAAADALYFSFQPGGALPTTPSSLLIQSPSYVSVPAGAALLVHLMRGDTLVSTSKLTFPRAYENTSLIPPVPVASFIPLGTSTGPGEPLPGASLVPGEADLIKVALEPAAYRLLWTLSAGVMGTPGRAVVTGAPVSFVDLKLIGVSSASLLGDQKPGSVLFFSRYTSNASNPPREDTTINLTNTSPAASIFVRLFLINGATCEPQKVEICLAAQQTVSYQMSDLDPGIKGYVVAVATNQLGEPIQFNWLTGNTIIRQSAANIGGPFTSMVGAIAIAKRKEGELKPGQNNEAEMIFDDLNYDRLPLQSAFDGVPSQVNAANATLFAFYRPLANLGGGPANATVQITGWGRNELNQVVTSNGSVSTACYNDFAVSQIRLLPTPVAQLLPSGATAWFAASTSDSQPLLGVQLNSGQFNSGGNARALSYAAEYRIKVPVSVVTCP